MARGLGVESKRAAAIAGAAAMLAGATALTIAIDGFIVEIVWSAIVYVGLGFCLDLRAYAKRRREPESPYDRHVGRIRKLDSDFAGPDGEGPCLIALARTDDVEDQMLNRAVPFLLEAQGGTFVVHGTAQAWATIAAARPTKPESLCSAIWASWGVPAATGTDSREGSAGPSRWLCIRDGDPIVLWASLRDGASGSGADAMYRRAAERWRELAPELSANPRHGRLGVGAPNDYRAAARWQWRFTWTALVSMPIGACALWLLVLAGGGAEWTGSGASGHYIP